MAERHPTKRLVMPAAIAAGLVLCGLIGWMIESRAHILRTGTEIVLKSEPIDPRDLLRGRYVILTYPAQRLEGPILEPLLAELGPDEALRDAVVYVTMQAGDEGHYLPVAAHFEPPDGGIVIKGTAHYMQARLSAITVDYGIGRFYTNEHRAPEIEQRMRDGQLTEIVIAVGQDGTAQIKALRQAGQTIVTEQLY